MVESDIDRGRKTGDEKTGQKKQEGPVPQEKKKKYERMTKKELIKDIRVKDEKLMELEDNLVHLQADLINMRKRAWKDKQDIRANSKQDVIMNYLNVKCNIDRAFMHVESASNVEGLRKGLKMVENQLTQFLENEGIKEISDEGGRFDPNLQEAVNTEVDENVKEETVKKMVEKGYMMGDKVIIPMKCIVSLPPEDTTGKERT